MGAPIIFIVEGQPNAYVFVYTTIVSIICFSILLLIFIPKIIAMRPKPDPIQQSRFSSNMFSLNAGTRVGGLDLSPPNTNSMSMVNMTGTVRHFNEDSSIDQNRSSTRNSITLEQVTEEKASVAFSNHTPPREGGHSVSSQLDQSINDMPTVNA